MMILAEKKGCLLNGIISVALNAELASYIGGVASKMSRSVTCQPSKSNYTMKRGQFPIKDSI